MGAFTFLYHIEEVDSLLVIPEGSTGRKLAGSARTPGGEAGRPAGQLLVPPSRRPRGREVKPGA